MTSKLLSTAALTLCLFAACKKESKQAPAPPAGSNVQFTIVFPTEQVQIDSMVGSYLNADSQLVAVRIEQANSWSSPELKFAKGKSTFANLKAYGRVTGAPIPIIGTMLHLVKIPDQATIQANGSSQIHNNKFEFEGTVHHTF